MEHSLLTRMVCPLVGYMFLSSTPPSLKAKRPVAFITAEGLDSGIKVNASRMWDRWRRMKIVPRANS